jgi:hypothetical protein
LGAGDAEGFSASAAGVGEESTDAEGEGAAVADTVGDVLEVGELAGVAEACDDPDGIGEEVVAGTALRTSLSRTPTRRPALCFAVSTVNNKVTPKKMQPR